MDERRGRNGSTKIGRAFGDLKVRPKLMVLHNLFFLVLAGAVYFSLIPLFEERFASALAREDSLAAQAFAENRPLLHLPGMEIYHYQEGTAGALRLPPDVRESLDRNPETVWQGSGQLYTIYRKNARNGLYRKLVLPSSSYDDVVVRAKLTLFVALGLIYALAVLALEIMILPLYVYRPIRLMLAADDATQRGDRRQELINGLLIPGDEIGQIMSSRNATVNQLRRHEDELAAALARLEEANQALQQKNSMLATARKNLAEQDRLVSLGLLSASVAHEMNTPLSVLHGSIEKLMETIHDRQAQERLARMIRVTERLRKISEGLVDFARARKQKAERVEIRRVVEESWGLVAIDEKASRVNFHDECRAEDAVTGNADRLVQVFVNLLRNALNAVAAEGDLIVTSRKVAADGGEWISVVVEDNGPGIPPDVLPNIFEAFVTTRLDSCGTGLGLTVAEGIVQQHGGTIEASNRPEGGARLEVRLPAVPARVAGGQATR